MMAKKPRVVIIGAGMAGLTAARRLVQAGDSSFDLLLLEASNSIGGRIVTSEIGGNRVELGATWIHGMEGSPLYQIAQDIGATEHTKPFERQDSLPGLPVVRAEGGLAIPPSIVSPMTDLYNKLMGHIRSRERGTESERPLSVGAFVAEGLNSFLSQKRPCPSENALFGCVADDAAVSWPDHACPWTLTSLQQALFAMNEYMERVETSANTLNDLDLRAEKEYKDYPGEHVTVPGGYISIINEIASVLPEHFVQFGKVVDKILWNGASRSCAHPVALYCSDGSAYEADHVIVTVPLGVLKAGVTQTSSYAWDNLEGRHVCRSVDELLPSSESVSSLIFEPPLPASKTEAIVRLGYGLVNKVFLQLNTGALSPSQLLKLNAHIQLVYRNHEEPKAGAAIPWWMRKTFSISPIYDGSSVLLCWFAGSEALKLESLSDEEIMAGVARTLASFRILERPNNVKRNYRAEAQASEYSSCSDSEDSSLSCGNCPSSTSSSDSEEMCDEDEQDFTEADYLNMFSGVLRTKWGTNPLFHGSYSFVATGASGDDIEMLAAPLPAPAEGGHKSHLTTFASSSSTCSAIDCAFTARDPAVDVNSKSNHVRARDGPPLQLLFAGEATVRTLYSTTHGAHLSGLREADRLLNHYALAA